MLTQTIKALKDNKLFLNLKDSDLPFEAISENLVYKNKGTVIYTEGDPAESIYCVISGNVKIIKDKMLGAAKQESKVVDDFFGEEDYLEGLPRTSTAIAFDDCQLVKLNTLFLEQLIIGHKILEQNLKRLPSVRENQITIQSSDLTDELKQDPGNEDQTTDSKSEEISDESITENRDDKKDVLFDDVFSELHFPELIIPDELPEQKLYRPEHSFDGEDASDTFKSVDSLEKIGVKPGLEDINAEGEIKVEETITQEVIKAEEELKTQNETKEEEEIRIQEEIKSEEETKAQEFTEVREEVNGGEESVLTGDKPMEIGHSSNIADIPETASMEKESITYKAVISVLPDLYTRTTIDELAGFIKESAREIFSAGRALILMLNKEDNSFYSLPQDIDSFQLKIKSGLGILWSVLVKKENINIKTPQNEPLLIKEFESILNTDIHNLFCSPLKDNENEVNGLLLLVNSLSGNYSGKDEDVISSFSKQSAIALKKVMAGESLIKNEKSKSLIKMANFLVQDVKKPILVSKRYVEHLKNKKLSEDVIQVLDLLMDQLNHVQDVIQSTSSYSEGKTILKLTSERLNIILTEILGKLESNIRIRNCELIKQFDEADPVVKIDKREFYHCCMHIIRNACDAMPEGGKINVSTRAEAKQVKIFFRDNGRGIPEEIIGKIFDAFISYGKTGGSGLGLSVTKKIINDHGGKISVESKSGEGSEFVITLPISN